MSMRTFILNRSSETLTHIQHKLVKFDKTTVLNRQLCRHVMKFFRSNVRFFSTASSSSHNGYWQSQNLSPSLERGYRFDRIRSCNNTPDQVRTEAELERLAAISLKTTQMRNSAFDIQQSGYDQEGQIGINHHLKDQSTGAAVSALILDKVFRILQHFPGRKKKDLEKYGRYVMQLLRTRTSSEIPRALSSRFLPEYEIGQSPIDKITQDKIYQAAMRGEERIGNSDQDISLDDKTKTGEPSKLKIPLKTMPHLARLARAHAEDTRHKLYQMNWTPEATIAYVAHRYPAVFASNFRILSEVKERCPDFRPKSVLDFGSGPAPSIAAAFSIWGDHDEDPPIQDVLCVEPSANMAQIGQYLLSDLNRTVKMEIRGQPGRDMLIRNLWNRLISGGILVLIERGTPTGFRFMHHIREIFLEEIGIEKFHFVAPCQHEGMCPMAVTGRDWCHFGQRVMRIPHHIYCKGSRAKLVEEEKFSFLVIRKSAGPRFKYQSEQEAKTAAEKSYFWPRIVMPVIRSGGHTLVDVCSSGGNINAVEAHAQKTQNVVDDKQLFYNVPNGYFQRLSTSRSKSHSMGYRFSRDALWGDLWRFPKRITRSEARPYIPEETRLHLDRLAQRALRVGTKSESDGGGHSNNNNNSSEAAAEPNSESLNDSSDTGGTVKTTRKRRIAKRPTRGFFKKK